MKNFLKSIGLIILYMAMSIFVSGLHAMLKIKNGVLNNVLLTLETLIIMLVFIYIFRKELKGSIKDFKENYKKDIPTALKFWGLGFLGMFVSNLLITILIYKGIAPNEEANRELLRLYPFYSVVSMCFLAPVTEELLFRFSFKDAFKNRKAFIIVTGLIFGSMHVLLSLEGIKDLAFIVPYSCLGFAFAASFYDSKNICTSMFAHIFHNTLTILIILANF